MTDTNDTNDTSTTRCPNPLCVQGVVQYGPDTDSMTSCRDCVKAGRHGYPANPDGLLRY